MYITGCIVPLTVNVIQQLSITYGYCILDYLVSRVVFHQSRVWYGYHVPQWSAWLRLPYCSDNGIAITIRRVNPNNPLRNVRMIMPGVGVTFKASEMSDVPEQTYESIFESILMSLAVVSSWPPWQWLVIAHLRFLRDSWSWAFPSMVSDAFRVELELRTSTLKVFCASKSSRKNLRHQTYWHKLTLDLFVLSMSNERLCCESCEEKSGALLNSSSDGLDSYQFGVWATTENQVQCHKNYKITQANPLQGCQDGKCRFLGIPY